MSLTLADLLSPTPQMPKTAAGGVVATSETADGGAFAEALKAFRAGAETATGEAGIAIPVPGEIGAGVPELPVRIQTEAVIGLEAVLLPAPPAEGDAAVETPVIPGAAVPATDGVVTAPVLTGEIPAEGEGETPDAAPDGVTDPNLVIAAPVIAPAPLAAPVAPVVTEDAALTLAVSTETPPDMPQMPLADAEPDTAPLLEGRASAAGAPPPSSLPPVLSTGDTIPDLPKEVVDALAPRAPLPAAEDIAAAVTKPVAPPVTAAPSAPIPAALQDIASDPDVISVQAQAGAVISKDAYEDGDASAPASVTPPPRAVAPTITPLTQTVATPDAEIPAVPAEPVLAADPETKAKAADGALAVLTQKPEAAPAPAKPAAPVEPQAQPVAAAPDAPSDVKAADPKLSVDEKPAPEKPVAERPAPAEKPVQQADTRASQAPVPVNDKPAVTELAAKSVQQQSQNLPATAIPQLASEIVSKVKRGVTRFEVRLDPPELGRIDVRIDVDKDGRVTSRLMVEKTETLDLLKADQRALERALHDAGFKSEQNSLSFSLKDQRDGQAKFEEQRQLQQSSDPAETEEEPVRHVADSAYRAALRGPGGFDLRV
ncbi:hypothetical protein IZ6_07250 [Terrihabitans soli]|uniref:Flagellar hook-length control protein-like C-terminal domain-containing protein n=1 Tax=Terrihabitans soli TaxID=708113 RepID=A0A6S6QST6_9HYPH|nr:flagellar hook-length control protein FliK [Terrihabitans soli]BCJ89990.1 hypothetical protein IZ6_07250 [Terrihabitans soli]